MSSKSTISTNRDIDAHRGRGRVNIVPPRQISKDLLIKCNKTRNREAPWQFFLKALTPLRILAKKLATPSHGFSTRSHL
jgi:hypothetical protein